MNAKERRRTHRVQLDGRVGGEVTVSASFKVVSLSEKGASIEMTMPLPIGARCELRLNLEAIVDVKSSVMNIKTPVASGAPYVLGLEFKALSAADRALLEAFLKRERGSAE